MRSCLNAGDSTAAKQELKKMKKEFKDWDNQVLVKEAAAAVAAAATAEAARKTTFLNIGELISVNFTFDVLKRASDAGKIYV